MNEDLVEMKASINESDVSTDLSQNGWVLGMVWP